MYFYDLNLGPHRAEPSWTLGPSFEQTWQRATRQCYKTNFKHLSQKVLKKKIFEYFSMYFYGLNLEPPQVEPSWILGPSFELIWLRTTRQCYIPNFKHLSEVILKKKIFAYFSMISISMYFYDLNLGPLAWDYLGPWDFI